MPTAEPMGRSSVIHGAGPGNENRTRENSTPMDRDPQKEMDQGKNPTLKTVVTSAGEQDQR